MKQLIKIKGNKLKYVVILVLFLFFSMSSIALSCYLKNATWEEGTFYKLRTYCGDCSNNNRTVCCYQEKDSWHCSGYFASTMEEAINKACGCK